MEFPTETKIAGAHCAARHCLALLLVLTAVLGCEPANHAKATSTSTTASLIPTATTAVEADATARTTEACAVESPANITPDHLIAHAGGALRGATYTNSLEAMDHSYANGYRLIEIDLIETSDGNYVGAHDWRRWREETASKIKGRRPTTTEFLNTPLANNLTPVDYAGIQRWLQAHPDATLVTDKIRDLEFLAQNTLDHSRLMVEVFDLKQFQAAREIGLKRPMLSIHPRFRVGEDDKILAFVDEQHVRHAAVSILALDTRRELIDQLVQRQVCIYAYTSNHAGQITEFRSRGVFGFYTDVYRPAHW